MQVIHDGCNVEMVEWVEVVPPMVPQYRDECVIARSRVERNLWWLCKNCGAKILKSEIEDGIRFADGKPVVINGKTVQTGLHRVVWHGGQEQEWLRIERETAMDRYKRLAREAGVDLHESTDCPPGKFFAMNSEFMGISRNAVEGSGEALTPEHLKKAFEALQGIEQPHNTVTVDAVDGCISRIAEVVVADNRMLRVGDQVLLHNVNDGWSGRGDDAMHDRFGKPGSLDWSGAQPPASFIDDVYESWDVEGAARSLQVSNSISDAVREYSRYKMFMHDMHGMSYPSWRIEGLAVPAGE